MEESLSKIRQSAEIIIEEKIRLLESGNLSSISRELEDIEKKLRIVTNIRSNDYMGCVDKGRLEFKDACRNGDIDRMNKTPFLYYGLVEDVLEGALEGGHMEAVVKFLLEKKIFPAYSNRAVDIVGKSGNMAAIQLISENDESWYWGKGFRGACESGNMEIVQLMIEKGAKLWGIGLLGACEGGHSEIVRLMIEKGAIDYDYGFSIACENGHKEVINLLIENGIKSWESGLAAACKGGQLGVVQFMIEKGATDWTKGFYAACEGGNVDTAQLMMDKGETDLNGGLYSAARHGHMNIVMMLLDKVPLDKREVLLNLDKFTDYDIAQYLKKYLEV